MADVAKLLQLRSKAAEVVRQWAAHQAVASRQLGTIANILSRLPALQDARNFAALPHAGATHQLVLSKQYASLEALLGKLHASLADFEQAARALERLVVEGTRTVDAQPRARYLLQPQGTDPSPLQCLEAVEDVWRMLRDELALKMATVSLISVESSEAQLAALQQVFIAQPNIDTAHFSYLLLASYA